MISFFKENLSIIIPVLIIFFTIDMFLIILKFKKNLEAILNLKVSYDILNSYYASFYSNTHSKLLIIQLAIENTSTTPADITQIKLTRGDTFYLASSSKIKNYYTEDVTKLVTEEDDEFININILSENILNNTVIPSNGFLKGYAIFENITELIDARIYSIVVETPNKIFEKEIDLNPLVKNHHFIAEFEK